MKANYIIETECYAYNGFFKSVKVFNYKAINTITNMVSGTLDITGVSANFVGIWKIKSLKNK